MRDVLTPYLTPLRALPFVQEGRFSDFEIRENGHQIDAELVLRTPDGEATFLVEHKSTHLSYALADRARRHMDQLHRPWILMAPYIGTPLGQYLAEHDVNYVDLQGNCHLRVGNRYIAEIHGRTPPPRGPRHTGVRAPGYQVLFALLADQQLPRAPIRTIAQAAGVSRQAVTNMLSRLVDEGLLVRKQDKRHLWVTHRLGQARDRWLVGYADVVRPKLLLGSYQTPDPDPDALLERITPLLDQVGSPWRLGGSAAGHRLVRHYRGPRTVIHVDEPPPDLPQRLKALPDANGPLLLMRFPGPVAVEGATPDTPHPLLVYSEMMVAGDERAREAAQLLLDEYLDGP